MTALNSVFMVGWEYPPFNSGGLGVACDGLTKALHQIGTQIYFTLPFKYPGALEHLKMMGFYNEDWDQAAPPFLAYGQNIISKNNPHDFTKPLAARPQSEIEHKVSEYADLVSQGAKKTQDDFGVIHAHDWMSFPAAIKLKKQTSKPMIAHIHSTEQDRIPNGNGSNFITQMEKYGLEEADKIIAVSYYTKNVLVNSYGLPADKIEVVHNGIEPLQQSSTQLIHFASEKPVIVFMGRLTMQKGASYFINLASKILEKKSDALFIVAGAGDEYRSLLFQTAGQNLSASVLFSGFLRGREKELLLKRANVFVMPSLSEPFGLVALEAAQHGVPVIVSNNSGVSEVLEGAIKVDFWDLDKMTQSILEILADKASRQKVINAQNQSLPKITWQTAAQKIKNIYEGFA